MIKKRCQNDDKILYKFINSKPFFLLKLFYETGGRKSSKIDNYRKLTQNGTL
jgi:hypothetical protein